MDTRLHRVGVTNAENNEGNMASNTNLNSVHSTANVARQGVAVSHGALAFWHTMIGKKVVMAVTGVVLVGFVVAHMLGNLKIFSGPKRSTHTHGSCEK